MLVNGRHLQGYNQPNYVATLIEQSIKIDDYNNLDFWLEVNLCQELCRIYLFQYWGTSEVGVPLKQENSKRLIIIADNEILAKTKGVTEAKKSFKVIHYNCANIGLFDLIECIKHKVKII